MIYLDHHAATPLAPGVREAVSDATKSWGNPSSVHAIGQNARRIVDSSRRRLAEVLHVSPAEIVLTSGGTEACNLAVFGLSRGKRKIVLTTVEHPAVAEAVAMVQKRDGIEVVELPVTSGVPASADWLASRIDRDSLVVVQLVNHEVGTVFPIADYGEVCRACGAALFVDASQGLGKVPMAPRDWSAAAVAVSGAKIGAPAGAGALYVQRAINLEATVVGGGQERGRRAGSPDVLAQAGFSRALDGLGLRLSSMPSVRAFRDRLEVELLRLGARINGVGSSVASTARVDTVSNVAFRGVRGDHLVAALDVEGVCVSSGAACSSGLGEPSPVVRAMYADEPGRAAEAVRFSLGPETPHEVDMDGLIATLERVIARMSR